jgi:hypothetical protein
MPFLVLDATTAQAAPATALGAPLTSVGETLATIRVEMLAQLGNRDDVTLARANLWINWAYRNLCSMVSLKETFGSLSLSLVASQPFYALPVQIAWIKRISVADSVDYPIFGGRRLSMIDEAEYRRLEVRTDQPTSYFRWRRMLVFWPTPFNAQSLAVDFKVRPDDLALDTDSPLLPIEFHEPLMLSAKSRAWRGVLNPTNAALAQNDFLAALRPLMNTDAEEREGQDAHMQPLRRGMGLFHRGSDRFRSNWDDR